MDTVTLQRLREARRQPAEIRAVASLLPPDEPGLDEAIGELIRSGDERAATMAMLAAVVAGRAVEAGHLVGAAPLLLRLDDVIAVVLHVRGDVVSALLTAVRNGAVGNERKAVLLLLAGWIWKQREVGTPLPPDLIPEARRLAREIRGEHMLLLPLFVLAELLGSEPLRAVLESLVAPPPGDLVSAWRERILEPASRDPLAVIREEPAAIMHRGGTMRRAVFKVGRNDPCPCGSGRKYKRCCFEKDQVRLQHSSDVAGVTTEELDEQLEPFLTEAKVDGLRSHKLSRLRLALVPPPLQGPVLERLALYNQWDALRAGWDAVGWRPGLECAWESCMHDIVKHRQRDLAEQLLRLRQLPLDHAEVQLGTRLLLLEDRPEDYLREVESAARNSLTAPRSTVDVDLAYALMEGRFPSLGVLVARGACATNSPLDTMILMEDILKVRDRFDLPPEDAAEWLLDRALELPEHLGQDTREELDEVRRRLDTASAEAGRLRAQMTELRAELDRQERLAARARPAAAVSRELPAPAAPAEAQELAGLRRRVDLLKSELKQRHSERNALRRELGEALHEAERLRAETVTPSASAGQPAPDVEDAGLHAEEPGVPQPPRVPVLPDRFARMLEPFPEGVRRATLAQLGALCAGQPAAFVGMRRLRVQRELCRVRIGADHRLLFRLHPDRLEVVELLNRRDFERRLKALT